jgi:hypothetical protein
MLVQRVAMPASGAQSWTVLGDDDVPIAPVERYLPGLPVPLFPQGLHRFTVHGRDYGCGEQW